MKYEAVTVMSSHVAKEITTDRIMGSQAIWTHKDKDLADDF